MKHETRWLIVGVGASLLLGCGSKAGQPIDQVDASATADAALDAQVSSAVPLLVASSDGVLVWRDSAAISANVAPDLVVTQGVSNGATALAVAGDRLYVGHQATGLPQASIVAFGQVHALTAAATPTAVVPRGRGPTVLRVDATDNLWVAEGLTAPLRFAAASSLTNASTPAATYTHPFSQIPAFAFEPISNILYGGQISGAGTLAWQQANLRTGEVTKDFTLCTTSCGFWSMTIANDRLYAAGHNDDGSTGVSIWPQVHLQPTATTAVVLKTGYTTGFVADVAVGGDVLAVAARDQNRIMIYLHAAAITADRAPDFALTVPELDGPSRIVLDDHGRMYVIDHTGVLVFRDVATAPTLVTKLTTGVAGPLDVALAP